MENFENLTHDECIAKVNTDLPGWLTGVYDAYRSDYPHLISNWLKVCKMVKTSPKKILLVKEIPHIRDENLNMKIIDYCNILARLGYIVRRESELVVCKSTGKIIPSKELHKYMLTSPNLKSLIPEVWNNY